MSTLSVQSITGVSSFDFSNTSFASAYGVANSGYVVANAGFTIANTAFSYGNSSYTVANAAFGKANTALQNTSGVFSGNLTLTGNLGIGTGSSGPFALDVVGSVRSLYSSEGFQSTGDTIGRDFLAGKSSLATCIGYVGSTAMVQGTNFSLSTTPDLTLQPYGGKVGVGTQTPSALLTVAGGFQIGQSATATNNWHFTSEAGDGKITLWNGNYGAGTSRLNIDSSGNITGSSPRYSIPNTVGTAQYVYLGRWSNAYQGGNKLKMKIVSSGGYNADINQNQVTEIYFKTSNGTSFKAGSTGNYYADGTMSRTGNFTASPSYMRVVAVDANTYDFYGYFSSFTGDNSFYEVDIGGGIWTNSSTLFGVSSPSGNYIDLLQYAALDSLKSWVNYNGVTPGVRSSGNISSVTKNTTGDYTLNFSTLMVDANYSLAGTASYDGTNSYPGRYVCGPDGSITTSAIRISATYQYNTRQDCVYVSAQIIR